MISASHPGRRLPGHSHPNDEDLSLGTPVKFETWGTQILRLSRPGPPAHSHPGRRLPGLRIETWGTQCDERSADWTLCFNRGDGYSAAGHGAGAADLGEEEGA